jgi:hypothetical protein
VWGIGGVKEPRLDRLPRSLLGSLVLGRHARGHVVTFVIISPRREIIAYHLLYSYIAPANTHLERICPQKRNNEAKVRRKTKSEILGKARVMTYQDIEVARAKRAEQDTAKEAKGKRKRGRKPKSGALEEEVAPAEKRKCKKRKSATVEVEAPEAQTSGTQLAEGACTTTVESPSRADVLRYACAKGDMHSYSN